MRFGICISMLAAPGGDSTGREALPLVKELGFDYVEMSMAQLMALSDEDFEEKIVKPLQASGLTCPVCNCFLPGSLRVTGPNADHDAVCAYVEKAFGRAEKLGTHKIVFGSGGARNYPLGFPRAEAEKQLQDLLRRLEPLCAKYDVTIVMEHLNKQESNLVTSLHEGVELVKALQLPHVKALLDNYHMMLGCGSLDEILEAGADLRHVHLARVLGRSLPARGDETDWAGMFSALRKIGYDGDCSIEARVPQENTSAQLSECLAFLRTL